MRHPRKSLSTAVMSAAVALSLLTACSATSTESTAEVTSVAETVLTSTTERPEDHDDAADHEWDEADVVELTLTGDTATAADGVVVDGSTVTVTTAGTYRVSGTLDDGRLVVDTADDGIVRLILDGVDISSSTTAPLVVAEAAEVMLVLEDGSQNTLSDAEASVSADVDTDDPNAALFSTADLTIAGTGALTVDAGRNDGITSKDGLVITAGAITVNAVDDGIRGKDYLVIKGGEITVTAGGHALKSDNEDDATVGYVSVAEATLDLTAGVDGINATSDVLITSGQITIAAADDGVHADAALTVTGGVVDVTESYEGLEGALVTIEGGDIRIVASDDGINAAGGSATTEGEARAVEGPAGGELPQDRTERPADGTERPTDGELPADGTVPDRRTDRAVPGAGGGQRGGGGAMPGGGGGGHFHVNISGGTILIDAGGDGIDANGNLTITGGTTVVHATSSGADGALDSDGTMEMSGGVLLAVGGSQMLQAPVGTSGQATLTVTAGSTVRAGTVLQVVQADGEVVAGLVTLDDLSAVVFSSPDLVVGASYEIRTGGSLSGEQNGGLYTAGDADGTTVVGSGTAAGQ